MSAPVMELTAEEKELLRAVHEQRIGFSRGRYFRLAPGQPSVDGYLIQRLRTMKLMVLANASPGRIPPTRMCDVTDAGRLVLGLS